MGTDPQDMSFFFEMARSGGTVLISTVALGLLAFMANKLLISPMLEQSRETASSAAEAAKQNALAAQHNAEAAKSNEQMALHNATATAHLSRLTDLAIARMTQ